MAKADITIKNWTAINANHKISQHQPSLLQQGRNASYRLSTALKRTTNNNKK
jgi:hypothetical protein